MLKKAKAEAESEAKSSSHSQGAGKNAHKGSDKGFSKAVLESSHQIWLAGLGAFAKAQQGGRQVFDMLVKQGEVLESKTRSAASQTADAARDAAKAKAKEMQSMAGGTWDKLEQVFENRVSRALARLGVYTSSDVEKLGARVSDLSEAVNALLKAQGVRQASSAASGARPKRATRGAAKPRSSASGTAESAVGGSVKKRARAPAKTRSK